jgi:DNA (cytosine-5)-methyltransferase 1
VHELALFTGAGGGLLASKLLGWRTICGIESNEYCRRVLIRRQNERLIDRFPIWDDIRTFDGRPWIHYIDIITGGFPCQAFSTAAHGKNNAINLWPEMLRIVGEVKPKYVFAENVAKRAINKAAEDLEKMDFKTKCISLSAKDLGADHVRKRYWLLAYSNRGCKLFSRFNAETPRVQKFCTDIWKTYPGKSRMVDGMAYRLEQFRAIGNGQVPAVAATAFRILYKRILKDMKPFEFGYSREEG